MNIIDITLVTETLIPVNLEPFRTLWKHSIKDLDTEVLKLLDTSITQSELLSGNNVVIVRNCFEHPEKMIRSEVDEYTDKVSKKLKTLLEEILSSENKVFSIKSSITKFL